MPRVTVPVLKPLDYEGHSYVRGDAITVEPIQAAALARKGYVTLTVGAVVTRELKAEEPAPVKRKRGRPRKSDHEYQRRDLVAES